MKFRFSLLLALVVGLAVAHAAPLGPDVAVMNIRVGKSKELQRVVIGLYDSTAPLTVANFKSLIEKKFYNGLRFHRILPSALVQTGDPTSRYGEAERTGTGGPGWTVPAEIKLPIAKASVAMARVPDSINPAKSSNGSQFFAALQPLPKLDGKYTVFGEILEGLDVLEYLSTQPTNSNDFPLQKIVIKSIVLEPRIASPANP